MNKWTDTPPDVDSGTWHDIADALLVCCLLWMGFFLWIVL